MWFKMYMTVKELNSIFGKNIKKHRILSGFSQEKLAELMELSVNTICEIETGKKFIRAETLIKFSDVFKTEVYEFFKPETTLPDNPVGILSMYDDDVKKAMDKIRNDYIERIKH